MFNVIRLVDVELPMCETPGQTNTRSRLNSQYTVQDVMNSDKGI